MLPSPCLGSPVASWAHAGHGGNPRRAKSALHCQKDPSAEVRAQPGRGTLWVPGEYFSAQGQR